MELNQIRNFIAAAQTQNLSMAAQTLNITQSALSKSISNLEDELGVLLFDRSGKKVTLNESGKRFLEHARNMAQELDHAISAAKNQRPRPTLHLGLFNYSEKFMQCLKGFLASTPDIVIQLDHLEYKPFSIDTNEYDMLLFPSTPFFRKYKADVVYSDFYFLAVEKSNPLADKESVKLADLAEQKLIFLKYANNQFDLPYHIFMCLGIRSDFNLYTNSYEMQKWLISNDDCVGFVPYSCAEVYQKDPSIVLLPVLEDKLNREIMLGFKREKHLSAVGKEFVKFVQNYFDI